MEYWQKFTTAAGIFIFSIFFHRLNLNDNIIIVLSGLSSISAQIFRALAGRNEDLFMASISVEVGSDLFSAPIRAQMTRCISPEETGKVFAMLASLECAVPIITSMIFTNVYNATSGLSYPWAGTFYFCAAGFTLIGKTFTILKLHSIFVFRINHRGDSLHTTWGKDGAHRHREYKRTQ